MMTALFRAINLRYMVALFVSNQSTLNVRIYLKKHLNSILILFHLSTSIKNTMRLLFVVKKHNTCILI